MADWLHDSSSSSVSARLQAGCQGGNPFHLAGTAGVESRPSGGHRVRPPPVREPPGPFGRIPHQGRPRMQRSEAVKLAGSPLQAPAGTRTAASTILLLRPIRRRADRTGSCCRRRRARTWNGLDGQTAHCRPLCPLRPHLARSRSGHTAVRARSTMASMSSTQKPKWCMPN
jgi:hypothetical protein